MTQQAKITSLDVLESFRASLIVFGTRAHNALDSALDDVRRTRQWLQHDQRTHWEAQLRRRRRELDQAEQELLSAKLSTLRDSATLQKNAVLKARRAVAEAEEKLRAIRLWSRDFDHKVDPLLKRMEALRQCLDMDLPKGIAFLLQAQQTLDAYASMGTLPPQNASAPTSAPTSDAAPAAPADSPQP